MTSASKLVHIWILCFKKTSDISNISF